MELLPLAEVDVAEPFVVGVVHMGSELELAGRVAEHMERGLGPLEGEQLPVVQGTAATRSAAWLDWARSD